MNCPLFASPTAAMSSCLSGGGRTYQFDLEIIHKSRWISASRASSSPPPSSSSSPVSTLSESSNSPISISTTKARTPRKRPNQIYNEAAALLSTVYPTIFSTKYLENPRKFSNFEDYFSDESSDLLLPLPDVETASFLLRQPIPAKPDPRIEPRYSLRFPENQCGNNQSISKSPQLDDELDEDEFDAESILDEETGEGIDSIMGKLSASAAAGDEAAEAAASYGIPVGLGFGTRRGIRPLKRVDEASWWNFSTVVDVVEISPKLNSRASDSNSVDNKQKKKNNKKKAAKTPSEPKTQTSSAAADAAAKGRPKPGGLMLKLNYDGVLDTWSRRGRPFSGERPVPDVPVELADFDSFPNNGIEREGTGSRHKEKRHTRLFSKKTEYQVKKAPAYERPRVKGRFVRRPDSCCSDPK